MGKMVEGVRNRGDLCPLFFLPFGRNLDEVDAWLGAEHRSLKIQDLARKYLDTRADKGAGEKKRKAGER